MKTHLKQDNFGNLDAEYYVEQAYELRREFYAQAIKKAVVHVKHFFAHFSITRPLKAFHH
ncbi:hypothetical protein [Marinomonas algarum]|uniref:Uncharacterized protein n=1 Tax=Marinomonas algarum TaxID=2883105 RepID=A0A9X1IKX4_9GAMM|nr:hypothetical protein [Marinomonas algarum]MCB5161105.1 hypothetical protein [Marinomonas algarum]